MADKDPNRNDFTEYLNRRTVKPSINGETIIRKLETMLQKDKARQSTDMLDIEMRLKKLTETKAGLKSQIDGLRASISDLQSINDSIKADNRAKKFEYELHKQAHGDAMDELSRQKAYFSRILNTQKGEQTAIKDQVQTLHDTQYFDVLEGYKDKAEVLEHEIKELEGLYSDKEARLELRTQELERMAKPEYDDIALESQRRRFVLKETFWLDILEKELLDKTSRLETLEGRIRRNNDRYADKEETVAMGEQELDSKIANLEEVAAKVLEAKQTAQRAREHSQFDVAKQESGLFELSKEQEKLQKGLARAEEESLSELVKVKMDFEKREEDHKSLQTSLDVKIYEMESKLKAIEDQRADIRLKKSNLFDRLRYGIQEEITDSVNITKPQ